MKALQILFIVLGLISSLVFCVTVDVKAEDCSITFDSGGTYTCQELGDEHYNECLTSISNGEEPEEYTSFLNGEFVAPEKGYPTQAYCYEYAQVHSRWCFDRCPEIISLYGMVKPSYHRGDIIDPKVKAAQEEQDKKDVDCLTKSNPMMDKCYDLPEGDKQDDCFSKVFDWQRDCMYAE